MKKIYLRTICCMIISGLILEFFVPALAMADSSEPKYTINVSNQYGYEQISGCIESYLANVYKTDPISYRTTIRTIRNTGLARLDDTNWKKVATSLSNQNPVFSHLDTVINECKNNADPPLEAKNIAPAPEEVIDPVELSDASQTSIKDLGPISEKITYASMFLSLWPIIVGPKPLEMDLNAEGYLEFHPWFAGWSFTNYFNTLGLEKTKEKLNSDTKEFLYGSTGYLANYVHAKDKESFTPEEAAVLKNPPGAMIEIAIVFIILGLAKFGKPLGKKISQIFGPILKPIFPILKTLYNDLKRIIKRDFIPKLPSFKSIKLGLLFPKRPTPSSVMGISGEIDQIINNKPLQTGLSEHIFLDAFEQSGEGATLATAKSKGSTPINVNNLILRELENKSINNISLRERNIFNRSLYLVVDQKIMPYFEEFGAPPEFKQLLTDLISKISIVSDNHPLLKISGQWFMESNIVDIGGQKRIVLSRSLLNNILKTSMAKSQGKASPAINQQWSSLLIHIYQLLEEQYKKTSLSVKFLNEDVSRAATQYQGREKASKFFGEKSIDNPVADDFGAEIFKRLKDTFYAGKNYLWLKKKQRIDDIGIFASIDEVDFSQIPENISRKYLIQSEKIMDDIVNRGGSQDLNKLLPNFSQLANDTKYGFTDLNNIPVGDSGLYNQILDAADRIRTYKQFWSLGAETNLLGQIKAYLRGEIELSALPHDFVDVIGKSSDDRTRKIIAKNIMDEIRLQIEIDKTAPAPVNDVLSMIIESRRNMLQDPTNNILVKKLNGWMDKPPSEIFEELVILWRQFRLWRQQLPTNPSDQLKREISEQTLFYLNLKENFFNVVLRHILVDDLPDLTDDAVRAGYKDWHALPVGR